MTFFRRQVASLLSRCLLNGLHFTLAKRSIKVGANDIVQQKVMIVQSPSAFLHPLPCLFFRWIPCSDASNQIMYTAPFVNGHPDRYTKCHVAGGVNDSMASRALKASPFRLAALLSIAIIMLLRRCRNNTRKAYRLCRTTMVRRCCNIIISRSCIACRPKLCQRNWR